MVKNYAQFRRYITGNLYFLNKYTTALAIVEVTILIITWFTAFGTRVNDVEHEWMDYVTLIGFYAHGITYTWRTRAL